MVEKTKGLGCMLEELSHGDDERSNNSKKSTSELDSGAAPGINSVCAQRGRPRKSEINKKKRKSLANTAARKKVKEEKTTPAECELTESNTNTPDSGEYPLDDFLRSYVKSKYEKGAVVWAKVEGYSFWPAMIDEDPDVQLHFWVDSLMSKSDWAENLTDWKKTPSFTPTDYHVVFFDARKKLSRSWCKPKNIKPFNEKVTIPSHHYQRFKARFEESVSVATKAESMPVEQRLTKYSFVKRQKLPGVVLTE